MRGRHDARPCPSFSRPCSAYPPARGTRARLARRAAIVSGAAVGGGGRDSISRSAETSGGGHAHRLLCRLRDGVLYAVGPVDHRGPDPPWRVAPQPGPSTAGLWGRVALLAARADEPVLAGGSGQHRAVADLLCHRRRWWRPRLALVRGPAPT